jgi:hypothetical protein
MMRSVRSGGWIDTSANFGKYVGKENGAGKIGIADLSRVQNSLDNQPACLLLYRSFKRPATMPR